MKKNGLVFLVLLLVVLVYVTGLTRDLWAPDEPRVAEVGREMWKSGSLVPLLNRLPFLEKPFLHYGTIALSYWLGGEASPLLARIPSALYAFGSLILVLCFGWALGGKRRGILALLFLSSFQLFLFEAHTIRLDMALAFWVLFSHFFLWRAFDDKGGWNYLLFWLGVAMAFLTKGLLGLVLPGFSLVLFLLYFRRSFWDLHSPWLYLGALLPMAALALWTWILYRGGGENFLHFYYVENHYYRFLRANLGHKKNFFYYFYSIFSALGALCYLLPLVVYWMGKKWKKREASKGEIFLLLSFLGGFLFLSINSTKRLVYLVPLIPFVALLFAGWAEKELIPKLLEGQKWEKILLHLSSITGFIALLTAISLSWWFFPERIILNITFSLLAIGLGVRAYMVRKIPLKEATLALVFLFLAMLVFEASIVDRINRRKSFVPFFEKTKKLVRGKPLVGYRLEELHRGLACFYYKRTFPAFTKGERGKLMAYLRNQPGAYVIMPAYLFPSVVEKEEVPLKKIAEFHQHRKNILLARSVLRADSQKKSRRR